MAYVQSVPANCSLQLVQWEKGQMTIVYLKTKQNTVLNPNFSLYSAADSLGSFSSPFRFICSNGSLVLCWASVPARCRSRHSPTCSVPRLCLQTRDRRKRNALSRGNLFTCIFPPPLHLFIAPFLVNLSISAPFVGGRDEARVARGSLKRSGCFHILIYAMEGWMERSLSSSLNMEMTLWLSPT